MPLGEYSTDGDEGAGTTAMVLPVGALAWQPGQQPSLELLFAGEADGACDAAASSCRVLSLKVLFMLGVHLEMRTNAKQRHPETESRVSYRECMVLPSRYA